MDRVLLQAVLESAKDAAEKIQKLSALRAQNAKTIASIGRSAKNAALLFKYLEANPIIEIQKTATALGLTFNTTSAAVKRLSEAGILIQSAGKQRNRLFSYETYLALLREGT